MTAPGEILANLYSSSTATVQLISKNKIAIQQKTTYPVGDQIEIVIQPEKPEKFTLSLRVPAWSTQSTVSVNGVAAEGAQSGSYFKIYREWKKEDKVVLTLDMTGRLIKLNGYQAIMRGPVLLARDSRFNDGFVDETAAIQNKDNRVVLTPEEKKPDHIWMSVTAPLVLGTDLEGEGKIAKQIHFCDFASAGDTWTYESRYRVWIKQTLNVMNAAYKPY